MWKIIFAILLLLLMVLCFVYSVMNNADRRKALDESNLYALAKITEKDKNRKGSDYIHFKYLLDTSLRYNYTAVREADDFLVNGFYRVKYAIIGEDTVFRIEASNKLAIPTDVILFLQEQNLEVKQLEKFSVIGEEN